MKAKIHPYTNGILPDYEDLHNMVNVNWVLDLTTLKIKYITPNVKELTGYTQLEIIDKAICDTFIKTSFEVISQKVKQNLDNKSFNPKNLFVEVVKIDHKDKTVFPAEVVFQYREGADNRPYYHGYIRNRQVNNSSLKRFLNQEDKLLDLLKRNNQIISILAHDLRGPLGNLNELIHLVIENYDNYDPVILKKLLDSISATTNNTYQLMDNLVAWAKTHREVNEYILEPTNIYNIVAAEADLYSNILKRKSLKVSNNIPAHTEALCHKESISIVARNLLSNAIKFSQPGGVILFDSVINAADIEISISDSGVGIPENLKDKILDPAEKITKPGTNNETGTGLGLSLCKELVERNKGKLWFVSNENIGTTFYFSLLKD